MSFQELFAARNEPDLGALEDSLHLLHTILGHLPSAAGGLVEQHPKLPTGLMNVVKVVWRLRRDGFALDSSTSG
jgi:hypothetical protein